MILPYEVQAGKEYVTSDVDVPNPGPMTRRALVPTVRFTEVYNPNSLHLMPKLIAVYYSAFTFKKMALWSYGVHCGYRPVLQYEGLILVLQLGTSTYPS